MDVAVEVDNLTRTFGEFTAVDSISFKVKKAEIFGFLGPNGAGKSTTIRMLCGILPPTSGSGKVSGHDISSEQEKIKSNVGYMSQKFSLYDDLTVSENLEFFGSVYGISRSRLGKRISYALSLAEIKGLEGVLVKNLPVGMKQRLALGAAILHDPLILFLDEPTSGVDPNMRRNFWELIYRFSGEGKTIFVTTHYMDEAEHCDRIALIINGGIIAMDSPYNLKESLPYSVYSLTVDNFIEVFEKVSELDFVKEAAIFGSDIHLLCEKNFSAGKAIAVFMKKNNIGRHQLRRVSPTLEDVFVTSARKYG